MVARYELNGCRPYLALHCEPFFPPSRPVNLNSPLLACPRTARLLRLVDVVLSSLALVALGPLLLVVAASIRLTMGTPILFRQQRSGLGEQPFGILKFRTMRVSATPATSGADDARRLTRLGRFLRKTSLDELPELLNVIRGEMSLVGPRPLLIEYEGFYTGTEQARFLVRPGLTGLAQVSGRGTATWDQKLAWDAQFARAYSVPLYFSILLRTFGTLLQFRQVPASPFQHEQRLDTERADYVIRRSA